MIAGGGASVIYADTIVDLGLGAELANYGEYSGNPSTDETYEYAKTALDMMCRKKDPRGKTLIIGGGIANFTDVAKAFMGIIKAIKEFAPKLIDYKVSVYVRRGGPNYQTGLNDMKTLGESVGVPIHVYGPELHMTRIVKLALPAKEERNA
jgi:succinyl-CoA synthetase beta subunit